ncbi:hypothetical protein BDA96_05G082700 [Sorghum bicolor]|uniref:Bifunctional inhibitor/plant lipid transfer protein/seed storage helical domain-containing protein n=1 Tax=Sorghum bicolor TaxID=4558 RepID=A0A921UER0_SORBI|nr:hypothetical protein BDA96_05G082700 [Sorghum bicolor]
MAAFGDGTMGNVCLIVPLVFVMIIQSASFPTKDDVRCDVLQQWCVPINCNIQLCRVWYGEHQFKSAFCKRTPPFPDLCCCQMSAPPPSF